MSPETTVGSIEIPHGRAWPEDLVERIARAIKRMDRADRRRARMRRKKRRGWA